MMKGKDRSRGGRRTEGKPDRLDETNTHILRAKIRKQDPNPGNPQPPSQ